MQEPYVALYIFQQMQQVSQIVHLRISTTWSSQKLIKYEK